MNSTYIINKAKERYKDLERKGYEWISFYNGFLEGFRSGYFKQRSNKIEALEKYSLWLTKNGYMDTDWKDEEPFAIDEYLKEK
jgi:hypothetical protein